MPLPSNVTISQHPCLAAKLSQLRSSSTKPKETKNFVHEISLLLATEALGKALSTEVSGSDTSHMGLSYSTIVTTPSRIVLVPILRSGLGMIEAFQTLLPEPVPVHHLGLYREKISLQPVEYYNNIPTRVTQPSGKDTTPCDLAIIVDPIIATGGTAEAAVQTLREWGVPKILVVAILGSEEGVTRVATESGGEGIEIVAGAVDAELGGKGGGMIVPGVGDIGDLDGASHNIDLYEILGVTSSASKTEIKKAFHKAALASHPDKVPADERHTAEVKFKSISQAYEILYDEESRERYDRYGMAAFNGGGPDGMGDGVDLEDLLSQVFMGGMGGMGGMPGMGGMGGMGGGFPGGRSGGPRRKQKGADVQQDYEVSLEELYKGKTVKLASVRNKLCGICNGSGGKEKTKPKKCASCSGRGWNQALRQLGALVTQEQVICSSCNGTGEVYREKDRCKKCKGKCVVEEKKVLEIYIPRGSKEGDKIVLEGEADEKPGFETGNIIFVLEEKQHEVFERSGPDLQAPLKITLAEALTGFSRVVLKHLDGRGIKITHPQGKVLKPHQVLKVGGEGMPHKKGEGRGDLYLDVEIEFPENGWAPDVETIRKILPSKTQPSITGDPVDEVEFDEEVDPAEFGTEEAWEDDEDDDGEGNGPQCAQQ